MEEVKIDSYLLPRFASEESLRTNVDAALKAENLKGCVVYHRIDDEKAAELGLSRSPFVFIDGKELQPQGIVGFA